VNYKQYSRRGRALIYKHKITGNELFCSNETLLTPDWRNPAPMRQIRLDPKRWELVGIGERLKKRPFVART
jgi:hypothetical protein